MTLVLAFLFHAQEWRWVNPLPSGATCYGAAYGNGRFVAVGDRGNLNLSSDGRYWVSNTLSLPGTLVAIEWCDGRFLGVGSEGLIAESVDGYSWTVIPSGTSEALNALAWSGSSFVAVGDVLLTSPDGHNWTAQNPGTTKYLTDVLWTGSEFLITASSGVLVRGNGAQWNAWQIVIGGVLLYDKTLRALAGNGENILIASSSDLFSTVDLQNLSMHSLRGVNDLLWTGSRYVAALWEGRIAYSSSGSEWTVVQTEFDRQDFRTLACSPSRVICGGGQGVLYGSRDGSQWECLSYLPTRGYEYIEALAGGSLGYLAVGNNGSLFHSPTGALWRMVHHEEKTFNGAAANGEAANGEAANDPLFVVVGKNGLILTSPDASNWTPRSSGTSAWLTDAVWGHGLFVAVGQGSSLLTSADGISWQARGPGGLGDFRDVCWTGTHFVVVGPQATLASGDGASWSVVADKGGDAVAGHGTLWVSAERDIIRRSSDGLGWSESPQGPGSWFNDLAWDGSAFVAADFYGRIATSSDGLEWDFQDAPFEYSLEAVFSDASQTLVAGWTGTILRQFRLEKGSHQLALPHLGGPEFEARVSITSRNGLAGEMRFTAFSEAGARLGQSPWLTLANHARLDLTAVFPALASWDWVLLESNAPLDAFVELHGPSTLSAYEAPTPQERAFVPHVARNTALFETWISSVNASAEPLETALHAHPLGAHVTLAEHQNPWARSERDVLDHFSSLESVQWIEMQSSKPHQAGMEFFAYLDGSRRAALGLDGTAASTLRFLHVASDVTTFWTGMVLLNPAAEATSYQETYFDAAGNALLVRSNSLAALEKSTLLFDQQQGPVPAGSSWLEVQSAAPLVGYELFGSANGTADRFFAGLKCGAEPGKNVAFGHFLAEENRWIGYVVVNTGDQLTDLRFQLMDDYGRELATALVAGVLPKQKITRLSSALFPAFSQSTAASWVRVSSTTSALAGFMLWGDSASPRELLAGVTCPSW